MECTLPLLWGQYKWALKLMLMGNGIKTLSILSDRNHTLGNLLFKQYRCHGFYD